MMFVWHFKLTEQYRIFNELYKKHALGDWIGGRAIGGLVSLRGITNIDFSPFIGIAYRCLHDYIESKKETNTFRLHFLGVNHKVDRFMIIVLENLFKKYLGPKHILDITYDSINYVQTFRENPLSPIYWYVDGQVIRYENVLSVPDELIRIAYPDENTRAIVYEEIDRKKRKERMLMANSFSCFGVYGNIGIDKYMEKKIYESGIINDICEKRNISDVRRSLLSLLDTIQNESPGLFTSIHCKSIIDSFTILHAFHWWLSLRFNNKSEFDNLMTQMTELINFPKMIT